MNASASTRTPAGPGGPDALGELVARYARYSRSAGGLGSVLGGVLLVLGFGLTSLVEPGTVTRVLVALMPLAWLAAKAGLRHGYYQRDGAAIQRPTRSERRWHLAGVVYLAVVCLGVGSVVVWAAVQTGGLPLPMWIYLVLVALLPVAAWHFFWSTGDFIVGTLLFCLAAVVAGGSQYPPVWLLMAGLVGFFTAVTGWREHRDYLQLRAQLTGRRP